MTDLFGRDGVYQSKERPVGLHCYLAVYDDGVPKRLGMTTKRW